MQFKKYHFNINFVMSIKQSKSDIMNAMPFVLGAIVIFALAYRFYFSFVAAKVAVKNDLAETPAYRLYDGQNYYPMNKWVLFGHHFAAIAGAGPLVGPVLAAQFGFFPRFHVDAGWSGNGRRCS